MPAAPAVSCALGIGKRTRVTTSTPESPGIPARNGFTAYVALSPVTGLFATVISGYVLSKPGWADLTPQDLTPASGRQDHTILPYAATSLVRMPVTAHKSLRTRPAIPSHAKRCRVHRTPSRVRDDRDTPLCVGRDARICRDDSPDGGSEKFFGKSEKNSTRLSTRLSTSRPTGKSVDQTVRPARGNLEIFFSAGRSIQETAIFRLIRPVAESHFFGSLT
jgi:hypothetical protein